LFGCFLIDSKNIQNRAVTIPKKDYRPAPQPISCNSVTHPALFPWTTAAHSSILSYSQKIIPALPLADIHTQILRKRT